MKNIQFLLTFVAVALILNSCGYKRINYLQEPTSGFDSLYNKSKNEYYLQPGDILYVRIITTNEETNKLFNPVMQGSSSSMSSFGGLYILGYNISDSGYIRMPILGDIEVASLTLEEATEHITEAANYYLKEAMVIVKLASLKFSIVGEVNSPGYFEAQTSQLNIMEALAMASDITHYGRRNEVLILRQTNKGTKTIKVDLTDDKFLADNNYYIQPNDVIYVRPTKQLGFRVSAADYLTLIGTITSTIAVIIAIVSLNK